MPVAASYPAHADYRQLQAADGLPAGALHDAGRGRRQRPHGAAAGQTGRNSWGETNLKGLAGGEPAKMDDTTRRGRSRLAAAVSVPAGGARRRRQSPRRKATLRSRSRRDSWPSATRISPSNGALRVSGNQDLFLNAINWLAQQENLIAIRPRDPEDRRITLTAGPGAAHLLSDGADRPGPDPARRRADLVAEAVKKAQARLKA